jgi:CRISPR-associated protein Cas2
VTRMENYFWNTQEKAYSKKIFVLVIYDIIDNKQRTRFAKMMAGYGYRVQKSAFEALLEEAQLRKLTREIPCYMNPEEDSVRIYRMSGSGEVILFGQNTKIEAEDVILI